MLPHATFWGLLKCFIFFDNIFVVSHLIFELLSVNMWLVASVPPCKYLITWLFSVWQRGLSLRRWTRTQILSRPIR